ncbi:unnamed protein product [Bursaphelenchus xylophilus]|uniref:Two pore potassium channel protein sup-9 n=1 Tax=Bursaphelenchus xylophilus TaxID=6326 RepID=A0A1I7SD59_BURXY|nr:unnamed protein product [Bursaphelenchus xylophilus]CAG9130511.1 unnamed protein product [Bursaphelenchus xylophilus]
MVWLDVKSKRAIRLSFTTFSYLVFGGLVFGLFEQEADDQLRQEILSVRTQMQNKYNFSAVDFKLLEESVVNSIPFSAGHQWKFAGAFYFCTVVITTVGYGHSTPATILGKLFYMIFALAGIPLGLIMFQSIGERINTFVRGCLIKARKILAKYGFNVLREIKPRHLLVTSSSIGTLTILIGTVVFHKKEGWSIFDSFYYCVITLSTIGLGDRVAAQSDQKLDKDLFYVLFTLFFILFGLAIFSACINLLILEFMAHNADIVTARGRLRRLLSLKKTTSFRRYASSKSSTMTPNSPTYLHKAERSLEKTSGSDYMQLMYRYYRKKPVKFVVRRPPLSYIDHLVNTNSTRI